MALYAVGFVLYEIFYVTSVV